MLVNPQIAYATREIASTRLAASAASIAFSSIPATYKHLLILFSGQTTDASEQNVLMRFNGDTGANYHWQLLQGNDATAGASAGAGQTSIIPCSVGSSGTHASRAGSGYILIPEYAQTNFHKNSLSQGGRILGDLAAGFIFQTFYGHWKSTAAITTVTLLPGAGSFDVGTIATLYGMV